MIGGTIRSPEDFEDGDFRKYAPRFSEENFAKNLELVDCITELAKEKYTTPSALTFAWLLAEGEDIIPIPVMTNVGRLEENLSMVKIKLSKEQRQEMPKVCENAEVRGKRYPEAFAKHFFADTPELQCR